MYCQGNHILLLLCYKSILEEFPQTAVKISNIAEISGHKWAMWLLRKHQERLFKCLNLPLTRCGEKPIEDFLEFFFNSKKWNYFCTTTIFSFHGGTNRYQRHFVFDVLVFFLNLFLCFIIHLFHDAFDPCCCCKKWISLVSSCPNGPSQCLNIILLLYVFFK